MPSPSEVVTPKIVVRIAIISIKTANLLEDIRKKVIQEYGYD